MTYLTPKELGALWRPRMAPKDVNKALLLKGYQRKTKYGFDPTEKGRKYCIRWRYYCLKWSPEIVHSIGSW
jgi:hypothetical protein